jgi:hypothetical protein
MEFNQDQEIVLDIIKSWLDDHDAAFLAKEELIVYWDAVDGDIRKKDWVKLKLKEAANIVRSTKVPVGIMKHCTEDMFRAAAQEEGRTYIAGCAILGEAAKGYFNYNQKSRIGAISELPEHKLAISLISELEALQENILWTDLAYLYEQALKYCKLQVPNSIQRNKFIRYGLNGSEFVEKRNSKTYNGRYTFRENGKLRQVICIKLPHRQKVKEDWTKPLMREVVLRAVKVLNR